MNASSRPQRSEVDGTAVFKQQYRPAKLFLVLMPKVQPEFRRRPRPTHLHRNLSPCTILPKERIDRLQQKRLPPRSDHLRHLRVRPYLPPKLKSFSVQGV